MSNIGGEGWSREANGAAGSPGTIRCMTTTAEAIWWKSPALPGRELRAVSSTGSVDILPEHVKDVLAAITKRKGEVTRQETVNVKTPHVTVGTLAIQQAECDALGHAHMMWGLKNESRIHYSELLEGPHRRDMWLGHPTILDQWLDCSAWCVQVDMVAGLVDPTGHGYGHVGNSTDIAAHLTHITESQLQPMDTVTFGADGSQHAAKVYNVSVHGGITLCSHGQEAGPLLVTLESEHAAHGNGPIQYLRRGVKVPA